MNRSVVGLGLLFAGLLASSAFAQCQGGGRGGSPGGGGMMAGSMNTMGAGSASMLTSPGSWAYDQMLGQALARQMAMQAYQKKMEDQARRAEGLAKRQYWAAQRREQKATSGVNSPGNFIAANRSPGLYSSSQSLDIIPSGR